MNPEIIWLLILFATLLGGILSGIPVILVLAGGPLLVALSASALGHFDLTYLAAFPQRALGVMNNSLLIAIPIFVAMGVILEQSRQAEKMLLHMAKLLGQTKSTLALSVLFVSALIAASTGIIGATIVMLGVISLPAMLRSGVPVGTSSGLICAAGTLGQIIPPSIVLILLGDQISNAYIEAQQIAGNFAPDPVSVGHLFAGALIPGFLLVGLYAVYTLTSLYFKRHQDAPDITGDFAPAQQVEVDPDEDVSAWTLLVDILPPVLLIVAVLGSILMGIATPTEAASVGVAGTLLIAAANLEGAPRHLATISKIAAGMTIAAVILQRLDYTRIDFSTGELLFTPGSFIGVLLAIGILVSLLYCAYWLLRAGLLIDALKKTVEISAMVFGIIIAASMLALVFRGFEGDEYVQGLFAAVPGGEWGMLLITMLVIFLLGFVLEFVEIVFIVIPIVGPIILQADFNPIWFAILIALNIQTSFLTPPFGFALFYFRSVAPPSIKTLDIYKSVIPYVLLQIVAIGIVLAFPPLTTWLPSILFK
ncbi:MAG: TRAP transporter large permease subunit [Sneathiella sp.]